MQTVQQYLANVSPSQRAEYNRVKSIVIELVPEVVETISYGIPTFKYKGKYLLYFGAFKDHMSLFPGGSILDEMKEKLKDYKLSKGTIQYTEKNLVSEAIIKELIYSRLTTFS